MPWYHTIWTDFAVQHLAEHGVTPDEFEEVVFGARRREVRESASTGRPLVRGRTVGGRELVCVFEFVDEVTILPVTAYEPEA